ncbi:MAG: HIT domain-containing protein [Nanoarchaeota archaeon]
MQQLTEQQRQELQEKLKNMSPEQLKELQKQQCIFCQIVLGKIPSKNIYEDARCIAILDINPAVKGHILLLPKEHYGILPQLPEELLAHLFIVAKNLSQVILKTFRADGTNLFIANGQAAGQRAQHIMIHLLPRKGGDGLLKVEEKLIDAGMVEKVRSAVEGKLNLLLGVKKVSEITDDKAPQKTEAPKFFISSSSAKRYHRENCAFAQNIPEDKKQLLRADEIAASEKKPCTCVSGKKIPLPKKTPKKTEMKKAESAAVRPEQKKKSEEVSLDDIARLFS